MSLPVPLVERLELRLADVDVLGVPLALPVTKALELRICDALEMGSMLAKFEGAPARYAAESSASGTARSSCSVEASVAPAGASHKALTLTPAFKPCDLYTCVTLPTK